MSKSALPIETLIFLVDREFCWWVFSLPNYEILIAIFNREFGDCRPINSLVYLPPSFNWQRQS
jgi:hypothetical protein